MRVSRGFEVLRQVAGMPLPGRSSLARQRLWDEAVALVRDENLADPAYVYDIVNLDRPARYGDERLHVKGGTIAAPLLIPESGQLTALAFSVATLGPKIETRISTLFAERRAALAVMLDELSNLLLFEVLRRAGDRMYADVRRRGLSMAGELHAGDPGLDLAAQKMVLELAQAQCIGVELSNGLLMNPMKSGSAVFGVGIDLPFVTWSRCDQCPSREKCQVRGDEAGVQINLRPQGVAH